jgi:hypothetical protein
MRHFGKLTTRINAEKFLSLCFWARFFCPKTGKKNRAFRCKSSDLPMQILWAFRCNPSRAHQRLTNALKAAYFEAARVTRSA